MSISILLGCRIIWRSRKFTVLFCSNVGVNCRLGCSIQDTGRQKIKTNQDNRKPPQHHSETTDISPQKLKRKTGKGKCNDNKKLNQVSGIELNILRNKNTYTSMTICLSKKKSPKINWFRFTFLISSCLKWCSVKQITWGALDGNEFKNSSVLLDNPRIFWWSIENLFVLQWSYEKLLKEWL